MQRVAAGVERRPVQDALGVVALDERPDHGGHVLERELAGLGAHEPAVGSDERDGRPGLDAVVAPGAELAVVHDGVDDARAGRRPA